MEEKLDLLGIITHIEAARKSIEPIVKQLRNNTVLAPEKKLLEEAHGKLTEVLLRFRAFKGLARI